MLPEPEPLDQANVCKTPLGNWAPFPCVMDQNSSLFFSHTECALLCLLPQIAETGHTELRNCGQRGSYSPVLDFLHK